MKKRLLSLILSAIICVGAGAPSLAAGDDMLNTLSALGIMNGDENGNLNLEENITRAQFAKMAVAASRLGESSNLAGELPYSDVSASHWASGYIASANNAGWLNGYPDGSFSPDSIVTLAEAVTVLEKLLDYKDDDFKSAWPTGQMVLANSKGLTTGIKAQQSTALTRLECAKLVYNTLNASTKSEKVYASTLGHALDAGGKIDAEALIKKVTTGPTVIGSKSWLDDIGFTPFRVYRNGTLVSISAVQVYDVMYYSEIMSTVWAIDNPASGTLEAVLPNASSPQKMVVSGSTYDIGTTSASYAVSELGQFKIGDEITLLLGNDNTVAAVQKYEKHLEQVVGVVTAVGVEKHESDGGDRYTKDYISLFSTDGTTHKFSLDSKPSAVVGDIVSVNSDDSGVTVQELSPGGVSGRVNSAGTQIGTIKINAGAEILDVSASSGRKITAERLSGINLESDDVLACVFSSSGEIVKLVLRNVTGDVHSYGMLTEKTTIPSETGFTVYYNYISGGVSMLYPSANLDLGGEVGGVRIEGSIAAPASMKELTSGAISSVADNKAVIGASKFSLTQSVQVYVTTADGFKLTKLSDLDLSSHSLTGWYDALPADGGALRLIIAEAV